MFDRSPGARSVFVLAGLLLTACSSAAIVPGGGDGGTGGEGGTGAIDGSTSPDASFVCTGKPVTGKPSGTVGAGFLFRNLLGSNAGITDGYAVVHTFASGDGRPTLSLVFTDYPGCNYAAADLGKTGGLHGEIVMTGAVNGANYGPGTYVSSIFGDDAGAGMFAKQAYIAQPFALPADTCTDLRSASIGEGTLTILELSATRVRGEVAMNGFGGDEAVRGSFDLPVCNYPSQGLEPKCKCAP